jgi:hypothetical protein
LNVTTAQCVPAGQTLPVHSDEGGAGEGGGVVTSQWVAPLGSCTQWVPEAHEHDGALPLSDTHWSVGTP